MVISDIAKLTLTIKQFELFIREIDGRKDDDNYVISFRDSAGFLGRNEDYKSSIATKAREKLKCSEWKENWIGTGKIASCVINAFTQAGNLVNYNSVINLKNRLNPAHDMFHKDAERVLYDIYRSDDAKRSFQEAVEVFGGKYATIAFMFFIKNDLRFLPLSPENFDKSFALLGIDYRTSYRCNWENYCGFLDIINCIRSIMAEIMPQTEIRLIDAHSFVWIVCEKVFQDWICGKSKTVEVEKCTEQILTKLVEAKPSRTQIMTYGFNRSAVIAQQAKERANGICQLCRKPAPFKSKDGSPYLETHHIVWLSRGGSDSPDNVAALCPNCHTKMHIVDDKSDVSELLAIANKQGR